MKNAPASLLAHVAPWPVAAQTMLWEIRAILLDTAAQAEVGPLDEALKWRQPSWRPTKARTGSTLRVDWRSDAPELLSLYVDCKTDLASRMRDIYPDLPHNDGQRHLAIALNRPLPKQAVTHLAEMTFTYHRTKRQNATPVAS